MILERERHVVHLLDGDVGDMGSVLLGAFDDVLIALGDLVLDLVCAAGHHIGDGLSVEYLAHVILDDLVDVLLDVFLGHINSLLS